MADFKQRLRELREAKRLTKTQLAEQLGISRQLVTAYENGSTAPIITLFAEMADYFGVSADYLLGRESDARAISLSKMNDNQYKIMVEIAEIMRKHDP
jgi:transcriptional regulator with XRE-family HTH domain